MQNSLVPQNYPNKLVSPLIMNYAISIYDIFDCIKCEFLDNVITLQYNNNWFVVNLWHCDFHIYWFQWVISNFYTANLSWIDENFKLKCSASDDIHILQSPIKYIWKEIFAKILNICRKNNITSIKLTPLQITKSMIFYNKMIDYYPADIQSISFDKNWDMVFSLK